MKIFKKSTNLQKSPHNWTLISLLALGSYLGSLLTLVAFANINTVVLFQPPPKEEQPESTQGAASRQNQECPQDFLLPQPQESLDNDHLNLTAIVPDSNYGLTIANRPNFWIYLPKTSAQQAILSIKEKGINPHWQQSVSLTGKAGIIAIELSDDAPALETGKSYRWAVILVCGNRPNPNDPVVAAWIKRVDESNSKDSLPIAPTSLEKAAWYAQNGIWYDALNILIDAKKSSLDNWDDIWVKYLQSGGLDKIVNEPVISKQ